MIAEKTEGVVGTSPNRRKLWLWLNILITLILLGAGIWFLLNQVQAAEIWGAVKLARLEYIALSLGLMLLTLVVKTWRWRFLLTSDTKAPPPMTALFWSILLGQYVNLLVPFLRLGEIARIYAIDQQEQVGKARTLSTLVVEKTLDLVVLGGMMGLLLWLVVLPEFFNGSYLSIGLAAVFILIFFYLLAYQMNWVVRLTKKVASWLPPAIGSRLVKIVVSGLEGLASLKNGRVLLSLLGISTLIGILMVLTPWLLFPAFGIELGLVAATIINVGLTLALVPPSTPGKLVIFDGTVAFLLVQLGLENEAVIAGYTIVFHLIIVLPQILLGSVAASRTNWGWIQPSKA